jgi:ribosomal protein S18 acetylase RimI-like enzyme
MFDEDIRIVKYSNVHARSIAENLFDGVPEDVIIEQKEELLEPGPDEVFSVCALHNEEVVGVCTGVRMRWFGVRHRIELVQVVVKEGYRGRGIAHEMMQKVAKHFVSRDVEMVQISVESTNTVAKEAYERIGFTEFGILENGINNEGEYSDEVMMVIPIDELAND